MLLLLLLLLLWLLSWDVSVSLSAIGCLCMCVTSLAFEWSVSGLRERASKSVTFKHDSPSEKAVPTFYFIHTESGTRSKWRPLYKNEYLSNRDVCIHKNCQRDVIVCVCARTVGVSYSLSLVNSFQPKLCAIRIAKKHQQQHTLLWLVSVSYHLFIHLLSMWIESRDIFILESL